MRACVGMTRKHRGTVGKEAVDGGGAYVLLWTGTALVELDYGSLSWGFGSRMRTVLSTMWGALHTCSHSSLHLRLTVLQEN